MPWASCCWPTRTRWPPFPKLCEKAQPPFSTFVPINSPPCFQAGYGASQRARPIRQEPREGPGFPRALEADAALSDGEAQSRLLALQKPQAQAFAALIRRFRGIYCAKKDERGVIDFSDMEQLALEALSDPEIAKEYQKRFTHIFIDEYQDSSEIQEAIIGKFSAKGSVSRGRRQTEHLFLPRRQAGAFLSARKAGQDRGGQGAAPERELPHLPRSSPLRERPFPGR